MPTTSRTIMVIAGEASGDRIASRAIRAAKKLAVEKGVTLSIFGIGGDECVVEGVECYHSVREMSVVGFVEVARRFLFFRNVLREMTKLLDARRPDLLLLIDYPGFNIRLAKEARKRGIEVVYYVSPQVWAWHASRVHELKKIVDKMLVIFPFEEKIYRKAGLKESYFVGHPLIERIEEEKHQYTSRTEFAKKHGLDSSKKWLLVFAGSRSEEVRRLLPVMSSAASTFATSQQYQAVLVESTSLDHTYYSEYLSAPLARFRDANSTHELMHHSQLGILKSGTTTLEAALLRLPGVICYITHPITFFIGKRLVKLPYIGLANIALGQKLYPELLQKDVNEKRIINELIRIGSTATEFKTSLEGLASTLQRDGASPSERVAKILLGFK